MKQKWSLLEPMVDLFEKVEEGVEFAEAANTPISGRGGVEYCLPANPQDRRDGKIL